MVERQVSLCKERPKRRFRGMVFGVVGFVLLGIVAILIGVEQEQMVFSGFSANKPHHRGDHFVNLDRRQQPPSGGAFPKILRIILGLAGQEKHPAPSVSAEEKAQKHHEQKDSVTWLGHAAFQIHLKEAKILVDPMLGERASPFSFAGPKRFQPPGLTVKEIGKVDIIAISHNHYDHYDRWSLGSFVHREAIDIVVPLGMKGALEALGYKKIHEMDWWEERMIRGLRVVCYPVQHFSGRGLRDRARTLWAGWGFFGPGVRLFFAGDTGYFPMFKTIGQKDGPFDLAFVPIGAYEPRDLFKPIHMDPEEAIQTSRDLRAIRTVGMHWGTFPLSLEPPLDPPRRFLQAAAKAGYTSDKAWILKVGETRLLPRSGPTTTPTR